MATKKDNIRLIKMTENTHTEIFVELIESLVTSYSKKSLIQMRIREILKAHTGPIHAKEIQIKLLKENGKPYSLRQTYRIIEEMIGNNEPIESSRQGYQWME